MEQRAFGRSGLDVPVIGMGTWRTFDAEGEAAGGRRQIVDAALAAGTTLFDTSPMYGEAERVLAAAIGERRPAVLIADKIWTPSRVAGAEQIRRALDWYRGSIDIYQIHNLVAWQQHLPVLEDMRAAGQVRVIGATHYDQRSFRDLIMVMRTGRIQMVQLPYNAGNRAVEREMLPLAAELGLGVLVMQPLGSGALVGRAPESRDLRRLEPFGVTTWAQALLKWILSDRRVHCAIPATSRAERATENAAAGDPPWFDPDTRDYVASLATRT